MANQSGHNLWKISRPARGRMMALKSRASRGTAATKMSSTWMDIFSIWENKKEEGYKLMFDAQKEMMD